MMRLMSEKGKESQQVDIIAFNIQALKYLIMK